MVRDVAIVIVLVGAAALALDADTLVQRAVICVVALVCAAGYLALDWRTT